MRFGIMAMQMDRLIPTNVTPQGAMQYIATFDYTTLVRQIASSGFNLIELGGDLGMFMPQTFAPPTIEKLATLKQELGLSYTVHLPLWSVEPSTPLTSVRHGSVRAVVDCIHATQSLQPEAYVLHPYGTLASEFYRMRLPESGRLMPAAAQRRSARTCRASTCPSGSQSHCSNRSRMASFA